MASIFETMVVNADGTFEIASNTAKATFDKYESRTLDRFVGGEQAMLKSKYDAYVKRMGWYPVKDNGEKIIPLFKKGTSKAWELVGFEDSHYNAHRIQTTTRKELFVSRIENALADLMQSDKEIVITKTVGGSDAHGNKYALDYPIYNIMRRADKKKYIYGNAEDYTHYVGRFEYYRNFV